MMRPLAQMLKTLSSGRHCALTPRILTVDQRPLAKSHALRPSRMQGRDSDTAKPEVRAIQEATTTPLPQLISRVVYLLGDRLACFIADADDVRILESQFVSNRPI
jgi:hypothetical protein